MRISRAYLIFNVFSVVNSFVYRVSTWNPATSILSPWRRQHFASTVDAEIKLNDERGISPLYARDKHVFGALNGAEGNDVGLVANAGDSNQAVLCDSLGESITGEGDAQDGDIMHESVYHNSSDESITFNRHPYRPKQDEVGNGKMSRRLWKLLMALLIYRSKYGDYAVDKSFKFSDADEPKLKGYNLGTELDVLLSSIQLRERDEGLYNKLLLESRHKEPVFPACDTREAPHLLWLIGFPTVKYINDNEALRRQMAGARGMRKRISRFGTTKDMGLSRKELKEGTEGDPSRLEQVKKALIDDFEQSYQNECDRMYFNKTQVLPSPSNRAKIRPALLKGVISKLLELKQTKNPAILLRKPTRDDIEAGHHYAFYHWNFEDVVESMVLFNVGKLIRNIAFLQDMYMDYNREILIDSVKHGKPFKPITFNILRPEWRVPRDYLWPERLWGLPLGLWLEKFRTGDIDAKQHWVRRDVLDYLQFDWGDGLKYLTFTWDKLVLGLLWYINFRGHPITDMDPHLVISNAELVAKWGKPEEIQGLKLGYIFYSAMDQIQVLKKHHPERYEFLTDMGISHVWHEDFDVSYRSIPHEKSTPMSRHIKVSKDSKYLRD